MLFIGSVAGAQTKKAAPRKSPAAAVPAGPSTMTVPVYTDAQAKRGRYVYASSCTSCHSATTHTGATFAQWWRNKPLSDLFVYVATKMPKNDPGSLAPEDAADVVAYLLKMNAMPTGTTELYPDADSLKAVRIETRRTRSSSSSSTTAKRTKP